MKRLAIMVLLVGGMLAAALGQARAAPFSAPASNPATLPGSTKTVAPAGGCLNSGPINLTNCNDFTAKTYVYLQGSGLDVGTYDLYVTDPNGTTILSYGATITVTVGTNGTFGPTSLCPNVATQCFSDSPNSGNEYEAWACIPGVTPTSGAASTGCVKTDNFKVEQAATATATNTATSTPTNTPTNTPTSTPGPSATPANTNTPGPSPTPTNTNTPGPSPTPANTNTPGPSPTPTSTNTPGPSPTPTNTPAAPTATSLVVVASPTATSTPVVVVPTNTSVPPKPTNTPKPPAKKPTKTPTPVPTPAVKPATGFGGVFSTGSAGSLPFGNLTTRTQFSTAQSRSHGLGIRSEPKTGGGSGDPSLPWMPLTVGIFLTGIGIASRRYALARR